MVVWWHRLGALAAAFLLAAVNPALVLIETPAGCGCSMPSGPCSCCVPADEPSAHAHGSDGSSTAAVQYTESKRRVVGRCHLRKGTCETSAPHPVVFSSDTTAVGIFQETRASGPQLTDAMTADPSRPQDDRPGTGPEPPPPRRLG